MPLDSGFAPEPGGRDVKICLEPEITVADSYGFNSRELPAILQTVSDNRGLILKTWHEHFGNKRSL